MACSRSRIPILIICYGILMCKLTSITTAVPADRYMPPSWVEMCQAEVSQFKPYSVTSRPVSDFQLPPIGSRISIQNQFLKPEQEFRDKINSFRKDEKRVMGTTIPTEQATSSKGEIVGSTTVVPIMTSRTKMNNITCKISKSEATHWKLMDLHDWQTDNNINAGTTPSNRTVVFSIRVECETGANISLPWPMKSKGLLEVHVRNCGLVDQFSLSNNPLVSQIPDELKVLDIRDSFWLVDLNSKNSILENTVTDFINIDSDYDCGQDTSLEIYISRNVTFTSHEKFNKIGMNLTDEGGVENGTSSELSHGRTTKRPIRPEDRLITNKEALISDHNTLDMENIPNFGDVIYNGNETDSILTNLTAKQDFFELLKKIKNTRIQCDFVKLLVRDESLSSDTPRHLLQVSTQEATHPVLEVLNYSSVGMTEFPRELSQWRLYFPRLVYLDLSHNHITELKAENYPVMPDSPRTVVNVRYNNISKITPEILKQWASVDKFHVDFTHNPISCDCDFKATIVFIKDDSTFTGRMKQYEYVKHLHCHSPLSLKRVQLKSLVVDDLSCPTLESNDALIIALAVMLGTFLVLTILLIRFKFEIRILLYTRLHIRLPCDSDAQRNAKLYDAFVSYSNEDSDWVINNLVSYLEKYPICTDNDDRNGLKKTSNSDSFQWNGGASTRHASSKSVERAFKLCLHQRDFIPGKTIVDNIMDSIEASRHTIIVLSPSFMKSHWAMEELRQAYRQSLVEKTRHLIVVLLEKVPDEDMDPLLRRCVKTFTYLQAQDSIFRDKLVFSLSTKDRATRRRDRMASKQIGSTPKYVSNGSKSNNNNMMTAHENFTYIHDLPSSPDTRHNNQRAFNEYETIQLPGSQQDLPASPTINTNIINSNEVFQRPTYYSFPPAQDGDVTIASSDDNGYYSLEMPHHNSSKDIGDYQYENPMDLKGGDDRLRPDGPARVLSNSSTSSTTALTWNL